VDGGTTFSTRLSKHYEVASFADNRSLAHFLVGSTLIHSPRRYAGGVIPWVGKVLIGFGSVFPSILPNVRQHTTVR
jgi:hypothetical protein